MFFVAALASAITVAGQAQSVPTCKDGIISGNGFTVTLPHNLVVDMATTPETLHGFYISLPAKYASNDKPASPTLRRLGTHSPSYRYIAFDTKWGVGDMPSLNAVVESMTSNILDYIPAELVGSGSVMLEGNLPARLGTLPARRLVLNYRNSGKQPAIRQVVVAYRTRKDASAVVYLLTLNTTRDGFQEDVEVFSKVLAGFKLTDQ